MSEEKTKNMYLKTIFFPPKILKAIALQVKAGYFPNGADLARYAIRKFLYGVMDFSFWPPKIKDGPEIIEDIPSKLEKERMIRAYDLMKTHGIKSANRKLREEFGMGVSEKILRLFDEEIRTKLKLENKKNIGLVKEVNNLAKEKLNPTPKTLTNEINLIPKTTNPTPEEKTEIEKPTLRKKRKYTKKKKKKKINPKIKQAWDMALDGKNLEQIAEKLNIHPRSVSALLLNRRKELKLEKYPFILNPKKPKKKKREPLGNINYPKSQDHKINPDSLFDNQGNLLVSTRIITKKISEEA